jgi:multiple sugar transport system substrate-binding protein
MSGRRKKILGFVSVLTSLALLGAGCNFGIQNPNNQNKAPEVTLEYWSVFNDSSQMDPIIDAYRKIAPNVIINYKKLEVGDYENQVVSALAQGRGPDIFSVHSSWMPRYTDKLEPIPADQSPIDEFVPVVKQVADVSNQVYGLPYSVDTLAMYYNPKLLNSAGVATPPTTWDEFDTAMKKLVQFDGNKKFTRIGAAIGTVDNNNRGIDPLELLMLQNGTQMTNEDHTEALFAHSQLQSDNQRYTPGLVAFNKYLSYSKKTSPTYTWNNDFTSGFDEMKNGKLAILFNYDYNYDKIINLNIPAGIRVAPTPQITNTQNPLALANFWLEGVSKKSQNQLEAWKFITFATGADGAKIFADQTRKPGARMDILETQKADRAIGAFAKQAEIAATWYQKDVSSNEATLADMVNSVLNGKQPAEGALSRAETQISINMKQK